MKKAKSFVSGIVAGFKRNAIIAMTMFSITVMHSNVVYAGGISSTASTDAGKEWVRMVTSVLKELRTIAIPTGIVCGAVAALLYFFSKNQKVTEGAKDWGKRIVIGVVIICMLETIVNTILGLTGQTTSYSNFIS